MRRGTLLRLGLAATAVLIVTGCRVETDVQLLVKPDGTGEVVVTVTTDHAVVEAAPGLADDVSADDLIASGWTVEGPTTTPDGGLELVLRHQFATIAEANAILDQLSGPDGPLRDLQLGVGGGGAELEWTLDGQLDFSMGLDALADPALAAFVGTTNWLDTVGARGLSPPEVAGLRFRASLPGTAIGPDGSTLAPGATDYSANAGDPAVAINVKTLASSAEVREAKDLEERMISYLVIYGAVVAVLIAVFLIVRSMRRARL